MAIRGGWMDSNKVVVKIAGQHVHLRSAEGVEYMQNIATYVNESIMQVEEKNPRLSTNNCIILAALNIADELFKLRQQYEELDKRIEELRELSVPQTLPRRHAKTAPVKRPFDESMGS